MTHTVLYNPVNDPLGPILDQRGRTHGDFSAVAALAQRLKHALRSEPLFDSLPPEAQEALDLISTKMARAVTGDYTELEHWNDIQGYARLVAKRVARVPF